MRSIFIYGTAIVFGAVLALWYRDHRELPPLATPATVVTQIREVARLEMLEVNLYKKVSFTPSPELADTIWGDVWHWAAQTLRPTHGKVIVFATARLSLDLEQWTHDNVQIDGRNIFVQLPPLAMNIELLPGETEVIGSNLDTAQTAELLETAKTAFLQQIKQDKHLHERARASAQRALTGLLLTLGFSRVQFVDSLPTSPHALILPEQIGYPAST